MGLSFITFFFLLLPFLLTLIGWIVVQAMKRARNLLRLLPVALFILLCVLLYVLNFSWGPGLPPWVESLFQNGWFNGLFLAMFVASVALVAESGGAMLISTRSWEKRHHLLLASSASSGMTVVCIIIGVWLVNLWNVFPLLDSSFPDLPVYLVLGFVMMVVAIVTALVALTRTMVALRAMSAAFPKPQPQAHKQG